MKKDKHVSTLKQLEQKRTDSLLYVFYGLLVGLLAGLVAILYRFLLGKAEDILFFVVSWIQDAPLHILIWLLLLIPLGLIVGLIAKWEPMSAGSGIPQEMCIRDSPYIEKMAHLAEEKFPGLQIRIYPICNDFFGEAITVAGLLTGGDLMRQLSGKELGERLLLPVTMLRSGEEVFLDDVTVSQVQGALQVPVNIVKSSGADVLAAFLGQGGFRDTDYPGYEL